MPPADLEILAQRWRWRTLARETLLAGGAGGLAAAVLVLTSGWAHPWPWTMPLAVLAGSLALRLRASRPWGIGPARVAGHLDRTYPELEESCRLWLRAPEALSPPERLQRRRLDAAWTGLASAVQPRQKTTAAASSPGGPPDGFLRGALTVFAAGMLAFWLASVWRSAHLVKGGFVTTPATLAVDRGPGVPRSAPAQGSRAPAKPKVVGAELTVTPPAHTGRSARTTAGLDAEVEEDAMLTWRLRLDGPARGVRLVFDDGGVTDQGGATAELPLREETSSPGAGWTGTRDAVARSGLYHLVVTLADDGATEWRPPEVYALKVVPDAPPAVAILQPAATRTERDPAPAATADVVAVEVLAADDYGVGRDARLVATVAKGSGEGVKFRERTLALNVVDDVNPTPDAAGHERERRFATTLDLATLGMEAGDELYFHAEVEDNRPAAPNRARSETRFVVLRGPATDAPSRPGRGLAGVNLVPAYFRSQRQLILDTEQLVADRSGLTAAEFRHRAEDLGADQALLRLRYGQFVGEEREAGGLGGSDHVEQSLHPLRPGLPAGVPADLVHQHDHGGTGEGSTNDPRAGWRTAMRLRLEHEAQARGGDGHEDGRGASPDGGGSGGQTGLPPTAAEILAPYAHQHDSREEATFLDGETKASLRGALAEMWTAEGFLRTARPEEALGPERHALEILQELRQAARLYVQRVGFEPPPLRVAERRGRGDVADVPERARTPDGGPVAVSDPALVKVRAALAVLPGNNHPAPSLSPVARETLRGAESALTAAVVAQRGDVFLDGLRAVRRLREDALGHDDDGGGGRPPVAAGASDVAAARLALLRLLPTAEARPVRRLETAPTLAAIYAEELGRGEEAPPPTTSPPPGK